MSPPWCPASGLLLTEATPPLRRIECPTCGRRNIGVRHTWRGYTIMNHRSFGAYSIKRDRRGAEDGRRLAGE